MPDELTPTTNIEKFLAKTAGESVELPEPATRIEKYLNKIASEQTITEATDNWLDEHIDPTTGYVLDNTLTMNNAAPPASAVGDLKSAFDQLYTIVTGGGGELTFDTVPDEYVEKNGTITPYHSWTRSDYIPVSDYAEVLFDNGATGTQYNVFFDSNKDPISGSNFSIPSNADGYAVSTNGAAYMMISQTTSKFNEITVYVQSVGGLVKQAIYSATEQDGTVTLKNENGEAVVNFAVGTAETIEIPSYWENAISDALDYAKAKRNNGYINHIIVTDQHYTDNERNSANLISALVDSGYFTKTFLLGDLVDTGTVTDNNYKNLIADGYKRNNKIILLVTGNHDSPLDKSVVFDDLSRGNDVVFCSVANAYSWTWDDNVSKIRYIGIDRDGTYVQYSWLANAIINSPDGYAICIVCHYTLSAANPEWEMCWDSTNETAILALVEMIGKPFIGFITGHQHIDETDVLSNGAYLTTLICDKFDTSNFYQYYTYPTRTQGTDSEQAITILSINPTLQDVQFYRVGSCCNESHKNWGYRYGVVGEESNILPFDRVSNVYLSSSNGSEISENGWEATDFVDISSATHLWIATDKVSNSWNKVYNWFYNSSKTNIQNIGVNIPSGGGLVELTLPENAHYLRMCNHAGCLDSLSIIAI